MIKQYFASGVVVLLLNAIGSFNAAAQNEIDRWLAAGNFEAAAVDYASTLKPDPAPAQQFSLGLLHFLSALEQLQQGLYRYGLDPALAQRVGIPFLRLPVPHNSEPERVNAAAIRSLFEQFHQALQRTRAALDAVGDSAFQVAVRVDRVGLDIDGDGVSGEGEDLHSVYSQYNRNAELLFTGDQGVIVRFDAADVHWFKGYSSLLMGLTDMLLAHDWEPVYQLSAHLFFGRPDTSLADAFELTPNRHHNGVYADLIAAVHVMNLPVIDSQRLAGARANLLDVIDSSRMFWKAAEAETDDDREWLPNSRQTAITGTELSAEMIAGWHEFLDEAEQLLQGEKLIPHWRFNDGRGVNLRTVFERADAFDPVLWVQGAAALPFLESGELTSPATWRRLMGLFRGDFIGFAIWIN